MVNHLTMHFTLEEMTRSATAKRLGIDNTPGDVEKKKMRTLCEEVLEPIRLRYGLPIIVGSGYRCPALNKAVGGVKQSDHMYGCAADIRSLTDNPMHNRILYETIKKMWQDGELPLLKQCIDEYDYDWIHISYQDGRTKKRGQFIHIKK